MGHPPTTNPTKRTFGFRSPPHSPYCLQTNYTPLTLNLFYTMQHVYHNLFNIVNNIETLSKDKNTSIIKYRLLTCNGVHLWKLSFWRIKQLKKSNLKNKIIFHACKGTPYKHSQTPLDDCCCSRPVYEIFENWLKNVIASLRTLKTFS
jgi:uncharacterized protein YjhX (UPF0386 family)